MSWEPEDGHCRWCGGGLDDEYEQDAGVCCWCRDREEEDERLWDDDSEDDPINEHYKQHGYF
ncbi:hypothetical protein [Hymenobacter mucosus]|uniref:Uncharacterized protein n=1 Tax=Hymenobacter mucosus TaxID=1411120 RepID=A0A239A849_9BACT|nr:hypothetical protein [Hymenobacter mucosus]SNR91491.1 hypothetical protein SAMN06269173_11135 [Hymenobacter mucosus]